MCECTKMVEEVQTGVGIGFLITHHFRYLWIFEPLEKIKIKRWTFFPKVNMKPGMVEHDFNPSTPEVETSRSL